MAASTAHYIHLNTRDRESGTNQNATFSVRRGSLPEAFRATLESIQFPHQMYPFSTDRENTFLEVIESGTPKTVVFDVNRNYTGTSLATELTTAMNAAMTGTVTVTYDTETKKLTFVSTATFSFSAASTSLNELGSPSTTVTATSHESRFPVDLSGTKYVDVVSTMGGHRNVCTTGPYGVLARMPALASFGEVVLYEPPQRHEVQCMLHGETLTIQLRDDRGRLVQLGDNGYVGYSFQIIPSVIS